MERRRERASAARAAGSGSRHDRVARGGLQRGERDRQRKQGQEERDESESLPEGNSEGHEGEEAERDREGVGAERIAKPSRPRLRSREVGARQRVDGADVRDLCSDLAAERSPSSRAADRGRIGESGKPEAECERGQNGPDAIPSQKPKRGNGGERQQGDGCLRPQAEAERRESRSGREKPPVLSPERGDERRGRKEKSRGGERVRERPPP